MSLAMLIFNYAKYMAATLFAPVFAAVFTMIIEKRPIKPMIKGILMYPIFMVTWLAINVKCMIKPNTKWEKIEHKRDVKINDI